MIERQHQVRRDLLATLAELLRRLVVAMQAGDLNSARMLWAAVRPHVDAALDDEVGS